MSAKTNKTEMAIEFIAKKGTARSEDIAQISGFKSHEVAVRLHPFVTGGVLVSCRVQRPGKPSCNEYRLGTGVTIDNWREFKVYSAAARSTKKRSPVPVPRAEKLPNAHPRTTPITRGKLLSGEEARPIQRELSKQLQKQVPSPAHQPADRPQVSVNNSGSAPATKKLPVAGRAVVEKPRQDVVSAAPGAGGHVFRCAIYSDGQLVLEGVEGYGAPISIPRVQARQLVDYLRKLEVAA